MIVRARAVLPMPFSSSHSLLLPSSPSLKFVLLLATITSLSKKENKKIRSTVKNFLSNHSNERAHKKAVRLKMELEVPEGGERETSPMPQVGTLDLELLISRLLSYKDDPGKQVKLPENQIRQLCNKTREIFLSETSLLELSAPVVICGDIHGQYDDLLRHFDKVGYPPTSNFLFLGDYVDRGKMQLESICLLLAYKAKYPENFFLLRGNHETASINRIYGFYDECKRRYSIKLWKTFTDCFNCLPLAALVEDRILCMHGGLSPDLKDLDQIREIERPLDVPDRGLVCDLLWSDPDEDILGWGESDRGVSYTFGRDIVQECVEAYNISLICRAHQVVEDGYQFFQRRQLVTLFSAPNYCGEFDNAGGLLVVSENLVCSFSIVPPKPKMTVAVK